MDWKLRDLTQEMVDRGKAVKDVTSTQAKCIVTLSKCHRLISWLQNNVRGKYM